MGFFEIFSVALTAFYAFVPSLGLGIILLTVAVRLLLLPLSIKQTRSMREMQRIQPEVKRIQQKHKGDRQKMNEEMMALYKEHGVNPFGGCLPLLLQFPVLIALFYVVRSPLKYMGFSLPEGAGGAIADFVRTSGVSGVLERMQDSLLASDLLNHAQRVNEFLGIRLDCTSQFALSGEGSDLVPAPCGDGIISALPYLLLVALMGITTWYQQKQMQAASPGGQQAQQMQTFAKIMPVMLMFFAFTFPSGVVVYWLTTNIWTIGQQRLMLRVAPPAVPAGDGKAKAGAAASGAKPQTGAPATQAEPSGPAKKPHPSSKKRKRKR
ncbi:MAG: YidC/Oxa1 family membrane protein insertase [Actinomycetota bacterium]